MWLWIERRSADPGRGFRYPSVIAVAAPTCEAALAAGKARRGRRRDRGEEYVTSATTGTVAAAWFAERGARTEALRAELPRAAVLAAFDDDGPVETTAELICRLRPDEALSMAAIGRLTHHVEILLIEGRSYRRREAEISQQKRNRQPRKQAGNR